MMSPPPQPGPNVEFKPLLCLMCGEWQWRYAVMYTSVMIVCDKSTCRMEMFDTERVTEKCLGLAQVMGSNFGVYASRT